jgi:hypothetical protein
LKKGLEKSLPTRHHGLIPDNMEAIFVGKEIIQKVSE